VTRGLLDTSVVIALARGEAIELPDLAAISVVTLCGLHHGVLVANDDQRPGRLATLTMAERRFRPLALDELVAPHYGRIVAAARRAGRRPKTADALIAATAAAHELPVHTRDRDFVGLPGVDVVLS
jgi:predicted nucleic acid-binding protein